MEAMLTPVPARPVAGSLLLVDDMNEDALLLASLLAPLKARIVIARSAEEAWTILDGQAVELVVTDLNMLGASGLDLARELLGRHDVPAVIFMTGSPRAEDEIAAFALGAVAYLQKPVNVEHLIGLAREIFDARSALRTSKAATESAA